MEAIYNLQDLPKLETKADPYEYRRFFDRNSGVVAQTPTEGTTTQKNHFIFRISDINSFWLLSKAYLQLHFKIDAIDNADKPERVTAEYAGKWLSRAILRLGDTVIEDQTQYVYRTQEIEALGWSKQYADTVGSMMLYKSENMDDASEHVVNGSRQVYLRTAIVNADTGAELKDKLIVNADPFDVPGTLPNHNRTMTRSTNNYAMLPLVHIFQMLKVYDKVVRGLDIEIELFFADDNIKLIRSAFKTSGDDGKPETDNTHALYWQSYGVQLVVPRVVPPARIQAELNMQLAKGLNINCEFEKVNCYRTLIPTGQNTSEWNITTATSEPTRIYLFTRSVLSETRQRTRLRHRGVILERVDVFVNGEKMPSESLVAEGPVGAGVSGRNFNNYLRQFHDMQGNIGAPYDRPSGYGHSNVDMLGFENQAIIAIDLKQKISDIPARSSDISVTYKIDINAPEGQYLYAVVYSKAVAELQLSEARSVALIR